MLVDRWVGRWVGRGRWVGKIDCMSKKQKKKN